jgi:metal-responsive CopG/Arc/MetJ family transcriptional regulator
MKTAVSVPNAVFEGAERLARREGRSRSEVYSSALREYLARHAPEEVTDSLDRAIQGVGGEVDTFTAAAARAVVEATEW